MGGSLRWRLLICLALVTVVVGTTVFSNASFTSATKNTSSFAGGKITITNSKAPTAVLDASLMRPGQTRTGTLSITENDVPATYTLSSVGLTDTPASPALSAALDLKIEDTTGAAVTLFNGKLNTFSSIALGTFSAGQTKVYTFTVSWAVGASNPALQNASSSLTLRWKAVQ